MTPTSMDPESISGAVNLTKVGIPDTPEQREALASLESLLAMVEGWVDCVVWRAGMAHLPHIEQLREMMRRERAMGGPASVRSKVCSVCSCVPSACARPPGYGR